MTSLPAGGGTEDLAAVLTSGLVLVCQGCGEGEAVLECECCGEHLCEECWGDGDPFCESCMGGELGPQELGRPVVKVHLEAATCDHDPTGGQLRCTDRSGRSSDRVTLRRSQRR